MTNLIEKILLIGFGIFSLTIFSAIVFPLFDRITEFNYNEKNNLESYAIIINEINQGVNFVIQNSDERYLKKIEYPDNLNISFHNQIAKFDFIIEGKIYYKILEYNESFYETVLHQIPPKSYLLNISHNSILIKVNLINIY